MVRAKFDAGYHAYKYSRHGQASVGADCENNSESITISKSLGRCKGSQAAEFEALLYLMKFFLRLGCKELEACNDSEVLFKQMEGEYQPRQANTLLQKCLDLKSQFDAFSVVLVQREELAEAHELANLALKKKMREERRKERAQRLLRRGTWRIMHGQMRRRPRTQGQRRKYGLVKTNQRRLHDKPRTKR